MRHKLFYAAALTAGLALGAAALAQPTGGYGTGMMGGNGYGPSMMGGYGAGGMMGGGIWTQQADLHLTIDQVKAGLTRWLGYCGNPHLMLGSVTPKGDNAFIADIVTKDKQGLVQELAIDRHTGIMRPVSN